MEQKETETLKVDFSKVEIQLNFEGSPVTKDMRKVIGNLLRNSSGDIGFGDTFAKAIYYSDGPVEVPPEYISELLSIVKANFTIPVQEAFMKLLTIK